jgi:hypothetical protein
MVRETRHQTHPFIALFQMGTNAFPVRITLILPSVVEGGTKPYLLNINHVSIPLH